MFCEEHGYCDPRYCPNVTECFLMGEDFYCPLCEKKYETIFSLKIHFTYKHKFVNTECPICNKKYRSISVHCAKQWISRGDNYHAVFYYLYNDSKIHLRNFTLHRDARKIAMVFLSNKELLELLKKALNEQKTKKITQD